jgi:HSP20 family protein
MTMLVRTDPFRDLERLSHHMMGTTLRPAVMLMDAWREEDQFVVELDLPGVTAESVDVDVDRNVLTVKAERPAVDGREMLAAERPRGVFSRQLVLGDNLDVEHVTAQYGDGVLRLSIPISPASQPR